MWGIIFGLASVLTLAVLMLPVAARTKIPYTVILAVLGVGLGFAAQQLGGEATHDHAALLPQVLGAIGDLRITADVVLFLFLPALVFESALSLDLRRLLADIWAILFMAVIGLVISTIIVGITIAQFSGMALLVCLLLGAIISATDPVAVIALFKDLGAPKRLTVLVEGESLFNDATAIVLSAIFITMLTTTAEPDVAAGLFNFLTVFLGGILVGVLIARPAAWLMGAFRREPLIILTLTVTLPFLAFVIAEHFLHVSGVMAVVAGGLTVGSVGRRLVPPQIFKEVEHAWHQLAFWATSLIFLLVGIAAPRLLGDQALSYLDDVLVLALAATLARTLIVYGMLPALTRAGVGQRVSAGYKAIMVWGGLRGAVALALALVAMEAPGMDPDAGAFIGVMVTGYVLFTLLVQATTVRPVMSIFGLNRLAPGDQAMRDRSVASALQSVQEELEKFAAFHEMPSAASSETVERYRAAVQRAAAQTDGRAGVSVEDWVRIGLAMALAQERQIYLTRFGEGFTTTGQLRDALGRLDEVAEALKSPNVSWLDATQRGVAFRPGFRRALALQRRAGVTGPLASALARRLSILNFMQQVLREQRAGTLSDIETLLPADARAPFRELYDHRYQTVARNADALALQYPDYAAALRKRDLELVGLRLEEAAYDNLYEQNLIGAEIHRDLLSRVGGAEARAGRLPALRLRLDPLPLIASVPFFAELNRGKQQRIAQLLKVRFTTPGERLIARGDIGEEMYFIASGAVRVLLETGDKTLGTGEFFGELALLTDKPRNADVEALGFSTLLVLRKRDFLGLLKRNPDIAERIRRIARERLGAEATLEL